MDVKYRFLLIFAIVLTLITCSIKLQQNLGVFTPTQLTSVSPKHTIIVFVHGTILPLPSPSCMFSALNKRFERDRKEKKSWSKYYYEELRYKTLFKCKPIGDYGLEKVEDVCTAKYPYTQKAASIYANSYKFANKEKSANLHFYTFGWDGRLRHKSRVNSARTLYQSLIQEIDTLKNRFNLSEQDIEVILLGHSHGGNVLLNLAKAEEEFKKNLTVNKLLLFGTPVQKETSQFINSPTFEKIYNFYSKDDMLQVADIISTKSKSKRCYKNNSAESKLVQIELKIGKKKPWHAELWLFGGSSRFIYRPSLAIYPLPAFLFSPIIINELEQKYPKAHDIFAQIDKDKKAHTFSVNVKNKELNKSPESVSIPEEAFAHNY
jgi:hypothetical protein